MKPSAAFRLASSLSLAPALAAVAVAFLPASAAAQSTVITSCVSKLTNVSRIVPSAASCNPNTETSVVWNQQGPQGPQGMTGATGPAGATGATGATGAQGQAGATGATGSKGDTGAAGAKGDTGVTGAQGPAGATGAQGPAGATGVTGAKGDTGAAGSAGAKGDTGAAGATGPQGATGATGPQGATGASGPAGATGAQGPAGTLNVVGYWNPGATYSQGQSVYCATACAVNGSTYYLSASNSQNQDPSTNNGIGTPWLLVARVGAQGTQGAMGATGSTGATGAQGATGSTGATGPQGPTGANGQGFTNGSGPTQVYVTSTFAPYAPTNPVPVSGDATLNSAGLLTVGANAITTSKIAPGAVKTTNLDTAAVTTTNIASSAVTVAKIGASGTPSSSTFLRGDGTWAAPSGSSNPALSGQSGHMYSQVAGTYYFSPAFNTPVNNAASGAYAVRLPSSCTATFTATSYLNASATFTLSNWTPSITAVNGGVSTIISCTTSAASSSSAPGSCTINATLSSGQYIVFSVTTAAGTANQAYYTTLTCQ